MQYGIWTDQIESLRLRKSTSSHEERLAYNTSGMYAEEHTVYSRYWSFSLWWAGTGYCHSNHLARLWRQLRGHDCGLLVCVNVWPVEDESAKNGHHCHRQKCHRYNCKIDLPPVRIFASVLVAFSLLCLATRNQVYLAIATTITNIAAP